MAENEESGGRSAWVRTGLSYSVKLSLCLVLVAVVSAATLLIIAHGFTLEDCYANYEDELPHWFWVLVFVLPPLGGIALCAAIFNAMRRRWYMLGCFVAVLSGAGWWFGITILAFVDAPSCPS